MDDHRCPVCHTLDVDRAGPGRWYCPTCNVAYQTGDHARVTNNWRARHQLLRTAHQTPANRQQSTHMDRPTACATCGHHHHHTEDQQEVPA